MEALFKNSPQILMTYPFIWWNTKQPCKNDKYLDIYLCFYYKEKLSLV